MRQTDWPMQTFPKQGGSSIVALVQGRAAVPNREIAHGQ